MLKFHFASKVCINYQTEEIYCKHRSLKLMQMMDVFSVEDEGAAAGGDQTTKEQQTCLDSKQMDHHLLESERTFRKSQRFL